MPIGPKPHPKMSEKLPPVRVTAEERVAIDWATRRLAARAGVEYTVSDTVRAALALLLQTEAREAAHAGEQVPDEVKRVL
jgi:hypothetical protein